jgi:hypothetical protein
VQHERHDAISGCHVAEAEPLDHHHNRRRRRSLRPLRQRHGRQQNSRLRQAQADIGPVARKPSPRQARQRREKNQRKEQQNAAHPWRDRDAHALHLVDC